MCCENHFKDDDDDDDGDDDDDDGPRGWCKNKIATSAATGYDSSLYDLDLSVFGVVHNPTLELPLLFTKSSL